MIIRTLANKYFRAHRWNRAIVASSLLLTASFPLDIAQTAVSRPVAPQRATKGSPTREGSIKGRVVDGAGQPFPRAVVSVRPVKGSYDEKRDAVTDEDGSFNIDGLRATAYTVECEAHGYLEDQSDSSGGYHLIGDTVTLKLSKGGVITGKVIDESGEALVKANLTIQRVRDGEGRRLGLAQRWDHVETDDRGIYRAYGLEDGSYILSIEKVGEYEDAERQHQPITYYPSSTSDDAGEVVVRRGGEVSGIDIIRREMRGHSVSGKCSGAANKRSSDETFVKLVRARNGIVEASEWQGHEQNRAFSLYGVPDGDYYLIAQDDYDEPRAASTPMRIKVAGNDIAGIELKLNPFGSIAGRVLIESRPTPAGATACKPKRQLTAQEMVARALRSTDNTQEDLPAVLFGSETSSLPDENGNFVLKHLAPGRYRVGMDLLSEDYYVQSITTVGRSPERRIPASALTVKLGEDIKNVVINISDGAASLRGRITTSDQNAKPPVGLRVHLVPAEPESEADTVRFLETDAKENGEFAFANIAPGRYRLLARMRSAISTTTAEATEEMTRARLRSLAAAANNSIELQPCQRSANYLLRYVPTSEPSRKVGGRSN